MEATGTQGIYRRNGVYWGRLQIAGKRVFRSLKTANINDAKIELTKLRQKLAKPTVVKVPKTAARTVGQFGELLRGRYEANDRVGDGMRRYVTERLACLENTGREIVSCDVRKLTDEAIRGWVSGLRRIRSGSTTRGTLLILKLLLEIAVELEVIDTSPAAKIPLPAAKRQLAMGKKHRVSREKFEELLASMRCGKALSAAAADHAELLALSGLRLQEANSLTWADVDWDDKEIRPLGSKWRRATEEGPQERVLPFYPRLEAFLKRMWGDGRKPEERLVQVMESRKTLETHCALLGLAKLHHHDMRHLFAMWSIEAGIPVPTVASWLGHRDGGVLLLRSYHHARPEHLREAFQKL